MQLPVYNSNHTQQLLNKTCLRNVPALYAQDGKGEEALVHLKFFVDGHTWLITEADPETGLMFGYVCPEGELGYVHIQDLAEGRGSLGQGIERDSSWEPITLGEAKKKTFRTAA